MSLSKFVHDKPLVRSGHTTRHSNTNHEAESLLQTLLLTFLTNISVVLTIGAMEFQKLSIDFGDGTSGFILKILSDGSTQEDGVNLHLIVGQLRRLIVSTD